MKKITCDTCGKETSENYIEIGTGEKYDFFYRNNLSETTEGDLLNFDRFHDLHFCSKKHFIQFFFKNHFKQTTIKKP